jgi:hypothetical protein
LSGVFDFVEDDCRVDMVELPVGSGGPAAGVWDAPRLAAVGGVLAEYEAAVGDLCRWASQRLPALGAF